MKKFLLISAMIGAVAGSGLTQTADAWVGQGRLALSAKDITQANTCFAQALAAGPTNYDANVCYGVTRTLTWFYQPDGSNFLTRIGIPVAGRDIYDWLADPVVEDHGLPAAPTGVNANEFVAQARTIILPEIAAAITNLAMVTDTNYTITFTSDETATVGVTVDYGDLELIQAGLYGTEYLIYVLNAQNLDAQLTAIRSLATDPNHSIQRVLTDYPQLLTFATTNDLQAASVAFTNAANEYLMASAFIRHRPASEVRLFNYDEVKTNAEANFRSVLKDLLSSMAGKKILTLNTNYSVCMSNQFAGQIAWRELLPQFAGNDLVLGTVPDLTFGGLVYGLAQEDVEETLAKRFTVLPVGGRPVWQPEGLRLAFNTVRKHRYVLQMSTNLVDWNRVNFFTATNSVSKLVDPSAGTDGGRYYRLRDDTGTLVFTGTVIDPMTGLPVSGVKVSYESDESSTITESDGNFYLATTFSADHRGPFTLQLGDPAGTMGSITSFDTDRGQVLLYSDNGF